ncbi:peptidase S8/S53 domain-containing protein [Rhexocercosporidium sp. MPI-PUGE-AT-0058]|nr:peptidase S8/S53 domain-containing protein [Rhexocercosporidium sp. MPI-PUGE-AT-0058]
MKLSIALVTTLLALVQADATVLSRPKTAEVIPNQYIVVYKSSADAAQRTKHQGDVNAKAKGKNKAGVHQVFDIPATGSGNATKGFTGYAVEIDPADLDTIIKSPLVNIMEPDPTLRQRRGTPTLEKRSISTQTNAPWGLAKLSYCTGDDDSQIYDMPTFKYDSSAGSGIRVYVVDSGILTGHSEFGGRAVWGANFVAGSPNTDEYGAGTHTAGVIAGKTYGVAKKAVPVAVKVFDKYGGTTVAQVISGLHWVIGDAQAKGVATKSVVQISVAEWFSQALNDATVSVYSTYGMTTVVPGGDVGVDVLQMSPASTLAISVIATIGDLTKPWWSNWGSWADISAPGDMILSASKSSTSGTALLSGTVPASAFVAGVAAYSIKKDNIAGHYTVRNKILTFYLSPPYGWDPQANHALPAYAICINP